MAVSLSISITQNSQNIANNTSNVTVAVKASWTYGSYNAVVSANGTPQANGWLTIDGTKYTFASTFNTGKSTSGSQTIFTKTVNVAHGDDGKKTLACSASFSTYISAGTPTASASKTLTTIARKSTLSVANGTLGTAQTLTVSRQATSLTHSIKAVCGSSTVYIKADGTTSTSEVKHSDTSISFTPPLSWASQNTSGSSVAVTYLITTYSGSTSLGGNSYPKTCSIPASVKPTVSIAVSDAEGYASKYGGYVQGKSKFSITLDVDGSYGSDIKTIKTTVDGKSYTTDSFTTDFIAGQGTLQIKSTVTDTRNRSSNEASQSVTVLAYAVPKISALSAKRCDWTKADGTVVKNGGLQVTFSAAITALNNKNSAAYNVQYKKSSESDDHFTEVQLTAYAGNYAPSNGVYTFEADANASYDIVLRAADDFEAIPRYTIGSSVNKIWSIFTQGVGGWAFGKIAELAGYLDIAYKTLFRDHAYLTNDKSVMGTDTDGQTYSALIPVTASGNTSLGHGLYKAKKGNTHIYGNTVQFYTNEGIFTNDNNIYFDNNKAVYGIKPDGRMFEVLNPSNANGNVVIGWDNYEAADGSTHVYGHDLLFGVSNIPNPGTYRPYLRQGMSITTSIRTAGFLTNSKQDVYFYIPFSRPIVGSPTVTVSSGDGFVLRQDDKYTHGSSSDIYVKPSSYAVSSQLDVGVFVKATFTANTTNALNNAPIGIQWNGTITFS